MADMNDPAERRARALDEAVAVLGQRGDPQDVVSAARLFESYLSGTDSSQPKGEVCANRKPMLQSMPYEWAAAIRRDARVRSDMDLIALLDELSVAVDA